MAVYTSIRLKSRTAQTIIWGWDPAFCIHNLWLKIALQVLLQNNHGHTRSLGPPQLLHSDVICRAHRLFQLYSPLADLMQSPMLGNSAEAPKPSSIHCVSPELLAD